MFISVSVGRLYALQYPVYVESFGPGSGPGLPLKNVIGFFSHIDQFARVSDIARNPNDVPPPITVLNPTADASATFQMIESMSASGTLAHGSFNYTPPEDGGK
jgi:hypothetical protein